MNIPKRIIELAIEGEWGDYHSLNFVNEYWVNVNLKATTVIEEDHQEKTVQQTTALPIHSVILDKHFWIALGKKLGWDSDYHHSLTQMAGDEMLSGKIMRRNSAEYKTHELYDLILTDGNTDKFWEDILSTAPTKR